MSDDIPAPARPAAELEALRDERDLYRSLLLAEPGVLLEFMTRALEYLERLRALLRAPARDVAAFRAKIIGLRQQLEALRAALAGLELPTIRTRVERLHASVLALDERAQISGNDMLPVASLLEQLGTHLEFAAESAAAHTDGATDHESAESENVADGDDAAAHDEGEEPRLTIALRGLAQRLGSELGRQVELQAEGLEAIPEQWTAPLFDALAQLLRNAIEHGIEPPAMRRSLGKPERGALLVEFIDGGSAGCELRVRDDGHGLDSARIAAAAVAGGLLSAQASSGLDRSKLSSMIFYPGLSTAADAPNRGRGLSIVRSHVRDLGGAIQVSTRQGRYTRFRISLPPRSAGLTRHMA